MPKACGLYVGPTPVELTLKLNGRQIWWWPLKGIPRSGTYLYRILSSGSADRAGVRFSAF